METIARFRFYPLSSKGDPDCRLNYLDDAIFETFTKKFPALLKKNPGGSTITCDLPFESNEVQSALILLREYGLVPASDMFNRKKNEFAMSLNRTYERADWESASYINPMAGRWYSNYADRSPESGNIVLEKHQAKAKGPIGCVNGSAFIVSASFKSVLDGIGLKHLAYRDVEVETKKGNPNSIFKDHWELTSDLTLPSMSVKLVDVEGRPLEPGTEKVCHIDEGMYRPQEFHYKASALKAIEPFDLGLTREWFGHRELVASKRLYDVFKKNKIKMTGVPVRIDPD